MITDSKNRKLWKYTPTADTPLPGNQLHKEGKVLELSFCSPCGIAVEFDHIVYITDTDVNRVNIITTLSETARILENVGKIYSAFSVHDKDKKYDLKSLPEATALLEECHQILAQNEDNIRAISKCKLPSVLKGSWKCSW